MNVLREFLLSLLSLLLRYVPSHACRIDAVGSSKGSLALEDTCREGGGLCSECMR